MRAKPAGLRLELAQRDRPPPGRRPLPPRLARRRHQRRPRRTQRCGQGPHRQEGHVECAWVEPRCRLFRRPVTPHDQGVRETGFRGPRASRGWSRLFSKRPAQDRSRREDGPWRGPCASSRDPRLRSDYGGGPELDLRSWRRRAERVRRAGQRHRHLLPEWQPQLWPGDGLPEPAHAAAGCQAELARGPADPAWPGDRSLRAAVARRVSGKEGPTRLPSSACRSPLRSRCRFDCRPGRRPNGTGIQRP